MLSRNNTFSTESPSSKWNIKCRENFVSVVEDKSIIFVDNAGIVSTKTVLRNTFTTLMNN